MHCLQLIFFNFCENSLFWVFHAQMHLSKYTVADTQTWADTNLILKLVAFKFHAPGSFVDTWTTRPDSYQHPRLWQAFAWRLSGLLHCQMLIQVVNHHKVSLLWKNHSDCSTMVLHRTIDTLEGWDVFLGHSSILFVTEIRGSCLSNKEYL